MPETTAAEAVSSPNTRVINGISYSRQRFVEPNTGASYWAYYQDGTPPDANGEGGTSYKHLGGECYEFRFAEFERSVGNLLPVDTSEADPIEEEFARLSRDFPHVAALLAKDRKPSVKPSEPGLFDLGPVSIVQGVATKLRPTREEILAVIKRHVAGDLGQHGKVSKPSDDDLFLTLNLPLDRAASVAIAVKSGVFNRAIRSGASATSGQRKSRRPRTSRASITGSRRTSWTS